MEDQPEIGHATSVSHAIGELESARADISQEVGGLILESLVKIEAGGDHWRQASMGSTGWLVLQGLDRALSD